MPWGSRAICRAWCAARSCSAAHPFCLTRVRRRPRLPRNLGEASRPMKIAVFGPFRRTGALHDGHIVDLSLAYAKYLRERTGEPAPREMAEAVVPSDLARLIE